VIDSNLILSIFYYLATLGLIVKVLLIWINIRHIRLNQDEVPAQFSQSISLAEHQKAANYSIEKLKFSAVTTTAHFILLLLWLPLGGLKLLNQLTSLVSDDSLFQSLTFFAAFLVISILLNIPESLYSTFIIEEKFGFNKTTPKVFIFDILKQFILSFVLMTPLLLGILLFIQNFQNSWWIISWISLVIFQFVLIWTYPKFISPLFNKFERLDDENLSNQIEKLSSDIDLQFKDYFVMDASLRSSHGNAYFTGFGKNKRIVFFDTLLKTLNHSEVIAVLAHELGHLKKRHILKSMVLSTIFLGFGFYCLFLSMKLDALYNAFNLEQSSHIAIMLFTFLVPLITYFFTPFGSWLSRKNEYEADLFASTYADGRQLISALLKMYRDNSSTLTPSPLYSKFYQSHPPAIERVRFIESVMSK
jgi:STE24 endopeptidase